MSGGLTRVRWALLVAAAIWVILHVVLGLLSTAHVRHPVLYGTCLAAYLVLAAIAVAPLVGEVGVRRWAVVSLLLGGPFIELLSLHALYDGGAFGYANWAAGGVSVFIPALVFRGVPVGWVALSAVGVITAQTVICVARPGAGGLDLTALVMLAVPPQLWFAASWAIRRILLRRYALTARLASRAHRESATADRELWAREQQLRRAELREVLNFLVLVRDGLALDVGVRRQAAELARSHRDALRARALLDPQVRAAVGAARARGVVVALSSERSEADSMARVVRRLLPGLLQIEALTKLTVRIISSGDEAIVVLGQRGVAVSAVLSVAADAGVEGVRCIGDGGPDSELLLRIPTPAEVASNRS